MLGAQADTSLRRDGAGVLKTDGAFAVGAGLAVDGAAELKGGTTAAKTLSIAATGDGSAYDELLISNTGYNSGAPRLDVQPKTAPGSGVVQSFVHLKKNAHDAGENTLGLLVDHRLGVGTDNPRAVVHAHGTEGGAVWIIQWSYGNIVIFEPNTSHNSSALYIFEHVRGVFEQMRGVFERLLHIRAKCERLLHITWREIRFDAPCTSEIQLVFFLSSAVAAVGAHWARCCERGSHSW